MFIVSLLFDNVITFISIFMVLFLCFFRYVSFHKNLDNEVRDGVSSFCTIPQKQPIESTVCPFQNGTVL